MTRYVPPRPRQQVQARLDAQAVRLQHQLDAELAAEAAAMRAAGLLPHHGPDPWTSELRPCETGCPQHSGKAVA